MLIVAVIANQERSSFRDGAQHQTSDAQLRIGESRDSDSMLRIAPERLSPSRMTRTNCYCLSYTRLPFINASSIIEA
jgi:hypothetical protein